MSRERPPGVRYTTTAGPGDVGHRVVLRTRTADGRLTDLLGHVERWSDGVVVVRTRAGSVQVAEGDVVAGKRVPDPPPRR